MDMPFDFETMLPPLDYSDDSWTHADISQDADTGKLKAALSSPTMPGVENVWHPEMVDLLGLENIKTLGILVQLCRHRPRDEGSVGTGEEPAASPPRSAKMARFHWEIPYIEAETKGYQLLEGTGLAPRFLGHVHEGGRVIGVLLELVEGGRHAGVEDLDACSAALGRLHAMGVLHGDTNRHNFLVLPGDGGADKKVVLLDFEKHREGASRAELDAEMDAEMDGLREQLEEETGRGAKVGM